MVRLYGLGEDHLEKIEMLLTDCEDTVGMTARDNRLFVEAVLSPYGTGISRSSTHAICAGANAVSGSGYSRVWLVIPTMNTP